MSSWVFLALIASSIAIYAMIDIVMRNYPMKTKVLWFPIVVLLPLVGPIAYYLKRKTMAEKAREGAEV